MNFRKRMPSIYSVKQIEIPTIDTIRFANGTNVHLIDVGMQEINRIDIVHKAGRSVESKKLVSRATAVLLKDSHPRIAPLVVADTIDFYGSSIKTAANMDFSYSTMYTLSKYTQPILGLVGEIYNEPVFTHNELDIFRSTNINKLNEELSKNEVVSYRNFTELIFGENHPYGYNSKPDDFRQLTTEDLAMHYDRCFGSDNCDIFISGKINDKIIQQIESIFGKNSKPAKLKKYTEVTTQISSNRYVFYSNNLHQGSIKIGCKLFNKCHEDNTPFLVLNTLFGGYFGSRLMMSIRENLGYTYDIFSMVDQMMYDGCFYISTEADPEYIELIISEVYHQMDLLRNKLVSEKELISVKNYLMGNFINLVDGPINMSSFTKSILLYGMSPEDFLKSIQDIESLTPESILLIANKYLLKENMIEVIVLPHPSQ